MISIFKSKSRFYFNISLLKNLIFLMKRIINFREKKLIKYNQIFNIYEKSNMYFLEHGRSAFFLFLLFLKKETKKKKIIINSFTLFEMINMIIYAGFEPVLVDLKENSKKLKKQYWKFKMILLQL